ncbi:MAG: NADH-quinone oxidoreductase subunit NuoN [Candidatus Accumulibacter sp.]|nr:NADH-quinone oxidoreductase subunit NuoN [Accumulibacter sp.]MBL8368750.1 NADH-quinone oxidoreductase subunit NuoN [Accumulibacter sp.]MBN8515671.1 NADH-quinone oxidoreductase subunit NuoN [Accumulibacter sp.]MBO3702323.1 NADH-quinone oxidoreductase subunit NuoN [Accumulibacter sp.]HRE70683.1 NADH-quinone oxidoreductase subunit NuoN [Accumulibacter sp.]HRE84910.1 NADH-quinone oxidoreductase subunit NuoN [Accumulibacter sp.]
MQFQIPDLRLASAEIFMLLMACVILIVDLFVKDRKRTVIFVATQLTLVGAAVVTFATSSGEIGYTFSNMYVGDLMGDLLKLLVYLTVIIVLFYSRDYILEREQMARSEYYVLALFATLGMMVMISANHFLTVYIGLELLSLSLYALVAMNRDSVPATEAAMKYFVLGALASGLLLYGMSMIYGATGTLEITAVAERLYMGQANKSILVFGLVFLVSGIAFKLGVVPFHMWIPDVYHGAPTAVALLIATAPKLAAFAIVMRMLVNGLVVLAQDWQTMLILLSVLSMAIGNIAAIAQTNLKRMLAYSAISHMGFMLLGLVTGVVGGDARFALNAYSSSMFYVITYVLTSAGTFGMILLLARGGLESDQIDDFKGLNKRSPWFAAVMMMMMFSMAGIPFFVGFFAKFSVLQAVVAAGYLWLAVVAVLFSLIGCFYYLRVVKIMYFDPPTNTAPIHAPLDMKILMSANGLAVAVLGIFPQALMSLCAFALLRSL